MNWPATLIRDIARRRCVFVLGSGVSAQAVGENDKRPPTWEAFLREAAKRCGVNAKKIHAEIKKGNYLLACEWAKSEIDEDWNDLLRELFQAPKFKPTKIHDLIAQFDNRIVFSLNFDDIYDRAVKEKYAGNITTKYYYDPDLTEYLRGDARYIVKPHGSLDSPDTIIFTQKDYAAARNRNKGFYESFDAALLTHTFLFIGCGLNDPDITLLLENQNFAYQKTSPHYFLGARPENELLSRSMRENRNLKFLYYSKKCANHSGLVEELSNLLDEVLEARQLIATEMTF
jgi:SIR2-like domain